jgi:hypothetical protein
MEMKVNLELTSTCRRSLIMFFILTFAITWGIGAVFLLLPGNMPENTGPFSEGHPLYFPAVFSPTLSALLITWLDQGREGVDRLLSRLDHWRFGVWYYLFALLFIPALGFAAVMLSGEASGNELQRWYLFVPLVFSRFFLDPGPLGEELGWRGFALPRLLDLFGPLKASFILGIIWGVWHLPAFVLGGTSHQGDPVFAFLLGALAVSILSTWMYIQTGGSVLASVLLHLMINFSLVVIEAPLWIFDALLFAVAVVVIFFSGPRRFVRGLLTSSKIGIASA